MGSTERSTYTKQLELEPNRRQAYKHHYTDIKEVELPMFIQTPLFLYWVDAAPQTSNAEEETIQQNRHL